MPSLILADSSLELVPKEIQNHPAITSHANRLKKDPSEILLDNSWHFAAMKGLDDELKRGRPDLVHFSILEATTIPLYTKNKLNFYVHTLNDKVIFFGENVQIPKSYHRFQGLMEKLFKEKSIESEGKKLVEIKNKSFSDLIEEIKPANVIGFSVMGEKSNFEKVASQISDKTCIVIGGFQKGHFSNPVKNKIDQLYFVNDYAFESHVVVSRILYEYEKTIFM